MRSFGGELLYEPRTMGCCFAVLVPSVLTTDGVCEWLTPPARTIRIALLDDHALFRESVARLLAAEPEFEVVAAWGSMEEALAKLLSEPVDIVLLDFDLGQRDGAQFLRSARERGYTGKVLVVTAGVEKEEAAALIRERHLGDFYQESTPPRYSRKEFATSWPASCGFETELLRDSLAWQTRCG